MFSSRNVSHFYWVRWKANSCKFLFGKLVGVQYICFKTIKLVGFLQLIVMRIRYNCMLRTGEPCSLVTISHTGHSYWARWKANSCKFLREMCFSLHAFASSKQFIELVCVMCNCESCLQHEAVNMIKPSNKIVIYLCSRHAISIEEVCWLRAY